MTWLLRPLARLWGGVPAWVDRRVDVGARWANDTAEVED